METTSPVVNQAGAWECLRGQILDSRFEVGDMIQMDRNGAWMQGRDLQEQAEVLLFLEDEGNPGALTDFDRFREASFLKHPGLVRVHAAGRAVCVECTFIYLAMEVGEADLAEELNGRTLTAAEAAQLVRELAGALGYLHSENLVSCAVRAGGIWRVDGHWKLADYSQLRVPGQYPVQETRRLMVIPAFECPPEANDGVVSPAWDIWSLGSVLRKVFPNEGRRLTVPAPFHSIVRTALDPDPGSRPTLESIVEQLSYRAEPQYVEPAPAPAPEPLGETHHEEEMLAPAPTLPRHRTPLQENRVPLIFGALLATAVAAVLAFVAPGRMVHPESVHPAASTSAPSSAAPAAVRAPQPETELKPPSPFGSSETGAVEKEITAVLNRWVEAKRRRNVEEEMSCYAPTVDRFYGQRLLPVSQLRRQEQNNFSRIGNVQRFEIANVKFNRVSPEWAVVSFDKTWDFEGRSRFTGSSREEFVMRPLAGRWKISSQREVKVYWVRK